MVGQDGAADRHVQDPCPELKKKPSRSGSWNKSSSRASGKGTPRRADA